MIPKMSNAKFLPLFKNAIQVCAISNPLENHKFVLREEPISCQVLSTAPKFVVSDGHHKVTCVFAKKALLNMKEYYPSIKVKDLDKQIIILQSYAPHTHPTDKGGVDPMLHIYRFTLYDNNAKHKGAAGVWGKPAELVNDENMKGQLTTETHKHWKRFISSQKMVDNVPPLEKLLETGQFPKSTKTVIKFERRKVLEDELEEELVDYSNIEEEEEEAVDLAPKVVARRKEEEKRLKEQGRKFAMQRRQRPVSLGKALEQFMKQKEEAPKPARTITPTAMKKGVAAIIAKEGNAAAARGGSVPVRRSTAAKQSVSKSVRRTERKGTIPSEIKLTAKGFKSFINWKACSGNIGRGATDVTNMVKNSKAGPIKVDFEAPTRPVKKAFSDWASATSPDKKRLAPEGSVSTRKSVRKSKY